MPDTTLQNLSGADAKRRKLEALLRKRSSSRKVPLSVGQERLYRLARLNPGQPLYNVAVAYRLRGPVDPGLFRQAADRIAARHAVLRATFAMEDGAPVQRVAAELSPNALFSLVEIDGADETERERAVRAAVRREIAQIFDLEKGPLWRIGLFRLSATEHVMTLTMHHIVSDGWSFELLLKELGTLVSAFSRVEGDPLGPPPVQYEAYAERQRAGFDDPSFEAQRDYWHTQLAGRIPPLALPDDCRPQDDKRTADSIPFGLDSGVSAGLLECGKREGVSLFVTMLTAFAALLNRSSGQEDLLICTPVTGRHRGGSREVVGYCNNILPIRIDLSGDPSLIELLRRVGAVLLDAHRNQDVPIQQIAEEPGLKRLSLSRLLFSVDMAWPPPFDVEGLDVTPIATETGAADFDFSVSLWAAEDEVRGTLRYKSALFTDERVEKIAAAYREMLAALVDHPDRRLSELPRPLAAAHTEADAPPARGPVLPRFPLEERLARHWRAAFGVQEIGIHDDFRMLGASSLAVAILADRLKGEFGIDFPLPALFKAGTIVGVAALIENENSSFLDDPLAPIRLEGSKEPLFLFEGVSIYYPLTKHLDPDRPVYGLVRRNVSEFSSVPDLAAHYLKAIRKVQPKGPYFLGGLSFGGLVAFEAARQLESAGEKTELLALFDTPGPGAYRPKPFWGRMIGHTQNLRRFGMPYLERKMASRRSRRPAEDRANGETVLPLDAEAQRRAFMRDAKGYEAGRYSGNAVLFMIRDRQGMSDGLFDPALGHIDAHLGWDSVVAGDLKVYEAMGDHTGLLKDPNVAKIAGAINPLLSLKQRSS